MDARSKFYLFEASPDLDEVLVRIESALSVLSEQITTAEQAKLQEQLALDCWPIFQHWDDLSEKDLLLQLAISCAEVTFQTGNFNAATTLLQWFDGHDTDGKSEKFLNRYRILATTIYLRTGEGELLANLWQSVTPDHESLPACERYLRLSGQTLRLNALLNAASREHPHQQRSWLEAVIEWQQNGDILPAMRFARTGPAESRILTYLMAQVDLDTTYLSRIQTPKNTKRQVLTVKDEPLTFQRSLAFADAVEAANRATSEHEAYRQVMLLNNALEKIVDPEFYLIGLAVIAGYCQRFKLDASIRAARARYYAHCLRVSFGGSKDSLHLAGRLGDVENDGKKSKTGRFKKAQGLGKIGLSWLKSKISDSHRLQTLEQQTNSELTNAIEDYLLNHMHELTGPFQKVAQLGAEIEGFLPGAVRDRLATSFSMGSVQAPDVVERILSQDLGDDPKKIFSSCSPVPFALGSLGQVHEAKSPSGEKLAVKILYPDIKSKVEREFAQLKKFCSLLDAALPQFQAESSLRQWAHRIASECDYLQESNYQEYARSVLSGHPEISVPKTFKHLSSARVLSQEYVNGDTLFHVMEFHNQETKNKVGSLLVEAVLTLLHHGLYTFDIHPGNYIYDGDRLWLIDFGGSVFTEGFGHNFLKIVDAMQRDDRHEFANRVIESKFYAKEQYDKIVTAVFDHFRTLVISPFAIDRKFRFTPEFAKTVFLSHAKPSPAVPNGTLPATQEQVNIRIYWSLYSILGRLGAEANWYQIAKRILMTQSTQAKSVG